MTEDAWRKGFSARLAGEDLTKNPYPEGTVERDRWIEGWRDQDHHLRGRDAVLRDLGW